MENNDEKSETIKSKLRLIAYRRQYEARRILNGKTNGVTACRICRQVKADAILIEDRGPGRASYAGLQHCKSVWLCPVCSLTASYEKRKKLAALVGKMKSELHGSYLITYTCQHDKLMSIFDVKKMVSNGHEIMHSGRPWVRFQKQFGWLGSVRTVEIQHGSNGWHWHIHELAFSEHLDANYEGLLSLWQNALKKVGGQCNEHGIDVIKAYGAVGDYVGKWGIVPEIVSGSIKNGKGELMAPFQFLDMSLSCEGKNKWPGLFLEYFKGTKNVRQLVPSPQFRSQFKDNEENTMDIDSKLDPLATLNGVQWECIWQHHLRAQVINKAEQGIEDLNDFLEHTFRKYGIMWDNVG